MQWRFSWVFQKIFALNSEQIGQYWSVLNNKDNKIGFKNTKFLIKNSNDMVMVQWEKINFELRKIDLIFLEDYVCIITFDKITGDNFRKDILAKKFTSVDISLTELKKERYILIPKNSLSSLRLEMNNIAKLFKNEINQSKFRTLLSNTNIVIILKSSEDLKDFKSLRNFSEYIPEHTNLELNDDDYT